MSFLAEESSVESGRPIFLFEITLGAEVFRYTKGAEDVVVLGATWNAIPMKRDKFTQSSEDRDQPKSFQVPGDNQFASNYAVSAPSEIPTIKVYEFHWGDGTDVKTRWVGEIAEVDWVEDLSWVRIVARPIEGGLDASFPRLDDGILCPYMVYDGDCGLSEASFTFPGTASSVVGNTLVVAGVDVTFAPPKVKSGKIRVDSTGEVRMVVNHTATDTLELASPFKDDPTGLAVSVIRGCDRLAATCDTDFVNIDNFGGNPHLPTDDVHEGRFL
jgi:uncharacterized phage protein (TIGR02218 family)